MEVWSIVRDNPDILSSREMQWSRQIVASGLVKDLSKLVIGISKTRSDIRLFFWLLRYANTVVRGDVWSNRLTLKT
jgi:hypothetical protein